MRKHSAKIENASISGDKIATQITIRNLLDNAFKHNHSPVSIEAHASEHSTQLFQISVADNGIGTPDPESLFDQSALRKIDSGFGLLGVARMLKQRGGDIYAKTAQKSQGIDVRFTLPGQLQAKG